LQRFLHSFPATILSGLERFELLLEQAYVGGLCGHFSSTGKTGADEPDQKAHNEQNQNAGDGKYYPKHIFGPKKNCFYYTISTPFRQRTMAVVNRHKESLMKAVCSGTLVAEISRSAEELNPEMLLKRPLLRR
jgi:hypothetical protein